MTPDGSEADGCAPVEGDGEAFGDEPPPHPNSGAAVAHRPKAIKSSLRAMLDSLISSDCAARDSLMRPSLLSVDSCPILNTSVCFPDGEESAPSAVVGQKPGARLNAVGGLTTGCRLCIQNSRSYQVSASMPSRGRKITAAPGSFGPVRPGNILPGRLQTICRQSATGRIESWRSEILDGRGSRRSLRSSGRLRR